MKIILSLLFVCFSIIVYSQANSTIKLKWKIAKEEKLRYKTVMDEKDSTPVNLIFGDFDKLFPDTTSKDIEESRNLFSKLNQPTKQQSYISTLTNKGGNTIDIEVNTVTNEEKKTEEIDTLNSKLNDLIKMMQGTSDGIVLRGSVYDDGGIHSFWVKNDQKNLISFLFELPKVPIKVGDKWPLTINLISNDQNFKCDSSFKRNEVMLTELKKVNGETIALIKYDILEYVKGTYNSPSFFGGQSETKETVMKLSYVGLASFSVEKGRWLNYESTMKLNSSGVLNSNKTTQFALIKD